MKIKKILIVFFISIFILGKDVKADVIPLTKTFKQGVYDASPYEGYYGQVELITKDKPVTIILADSSGKLVLYETLNSTKLKVVLPPPEKGYNLIVIGKGEIFVTVSKT
jgi:hypothetical protein